MSPPVSQVYMPRFFYICSMIESKVAAYIQAGGWLSPGSRLGVALSGGADSVALLHVLLSLGYPCVALHCNFRLRGAESERDEQFVRDLCHRLQIDCRVRSFDTQEEATRRHISIEMAARDLRYAWFEEMRQTLQLDYVAVAHHQNDSVETLLLNLVRGTGINGLTGISPCHGRIIRPLLALTRPEIEAYLSEKGETYVDDATNFETIYRRNQIRLEVLPLLRSINPSVDATLFAFTQRMREVDKVYQAAMASSCRHVEIEPGCYSIPRILAEISPQSVLHACFSGYGFTASQLRQLFDGLTGESGKRFYAPPYELLKDRERLYLRLQADAEDIYSLLTETFERSPAFTIPSDPTVAYLDADLLNAPLVLRKWKAGDWFIPLGMQCRKKIRNYLRDVKANLFEKETQCVVTCNDEVVWLVGKRIDNRFRITDKTNRIICLRVQKNS